MDKMTLAAVAVFVFMTGTAFAQPVLPTELNLNLLNADGTNIDVNLPLTIDYTDGDGNPQSMDSINNAGDGTGGTIEWGIYNGKSNLYSDVSAKDGTDITLTVDGYEPIAITAAEAGQVAGNYLLNNVTPISPTTTTTLLLANVDIESTAEAGVSAVATTVSVEDEGVVMTAPSISSGSSATFTVPSSYETPLRQLVLKVDNEVKDVEVTVNVLTEKPAHVGADSGGAIHRYIDISHNVADAEINSATITFNVEKSWTIENDIDPDSVTLDRYSGGKWTVLPTTRLSEGSDYYVYEAASPGLSIFRISSHVATEAPATIAPATITGAISPPVTTVPPGGGKPIRKVLFAVLALAIVVFAVSYYRKK